MGVEGNYMGTVKNILSTLFKNSGTLFGIKSSKLFLFLRLIVLWSAAGLFMKLNISS